MKKLFGEFKKFISRGNVMALAVGMIIGAAFTAIISAVVNGILKPLINLIPISETGLQTVLREAVVKDGEVVTEALILDWGAVISAVITFLLTALVLFFIIQAFNKAQSGLGKVKRGFLVLLKPEVRALRKEGKSWAEIRKIDAEMDAAKKAEEERKAEEAAKNAPEAVLVQIRDLLMKRESGLEATEQTEEQTKD
ncbi:MAG TPA: hypothetical protein DIC18_00565 [Clostridiales bacterium]|nr:hypothetical protein [Clostridiales bacterium]HCU55810.1 hypothetical protein [Clostridiales bacterium]